MFVVPRGDSMWAILLLQTNDNERLNGKIQASQVKILELTRDNNKLLEQLKVLQGTQNQPGEGTDRIWKAMDTLNR